MKKIILFTLLLAAVSSCTDHRKLEIVATGERLTLRKCNYEVGDAVQVYYSSTDGWIENTNWAKFLGADTVTSNYHIYKAVILE